MTYDTLMAFSAFAFVTSVTPGPNNLMLMASGANFGFRRTIPHMLGIGMGFALMVALVGAGLIKVFDIYPLVYTVLKIISVLYLIYLAVKIATAAPPVHSDAAGTPITFLQAASFQWVNPKAWAMALTAISVYAPSQQFTSIMLVALIFGLINLPTVSSWTILGQQISRLLTNSLRLRAFNFTMAALLVVSLYPVLAAQ